mgnify:CR=1 FL=1
MTAGKATEKTTLTEAEAQRRREAWERANASVLMEGGTIDAATEAMQARHIAGEITLEDYQDWARTRSYD